MTVAVQDPTGKPLAGRIVQFSLIGGDGTLTGQLTDTTEANGEATAPTWRLGKSANGIGGQVLRVISGTLDPLDILATATSSFNIVIRFFDADSMTAAQQTLFIAAAQRLQGIIVADMANVGVGTSGGQQPLDITDCLSSNGAIPLKTPVAPLNEIIDDLVVYATVRPIDGAGKILASAGPCYVRSPANTSILGVMTFDAADFNNFASSPTGLQEVITHEMLHVIGVGSLWGGCTVCRSFIDNPGTLDPQYNAAQARAGCLATGGSVSCASNVPLEGCATIPSCQSTLSNPTNGSGTRDVHWREPTFGNELMTGFINVSPNPLSAITIGAIQDLGYGVNNSDSDSYTIAVGSIMASSSGTPSSPAQALPTQQPGWEHMNSAPLFSIDARGTIRLIRKAQ